MSFMKASGPARPYSGILILRIIMLSLHIFAYECFWILGTRKLNRNERNENGHRNICPTFEKPYILMFLVQVTTQDDICCCLAKSILSLLNKVSYWLFYIPMGGKERDNSQKTRLYLYLSVRIRSYIKSTSHSHISHSHEMKGVPWHVVYVTSILIVLVTASRNMINYCEK